jgi:putative FmdB family regulatory protein
MPLYDYICECGVISERIVKYEDEDKQECPRCKKIMTKQFPNIKKQKEEEGKIMMPVTENIK